MTRSEQRIVNNKIRRKNERRKNLLLFVIAIFLVLLLSFTVNVFLSKAQSEDQEIEFKYYKSVLVKNGDTLWSLASENKNFSYTSNEEYYEEIMQINGLKDDKITAGSYLIVPYFSTEFQG